MNTLNNEYLNIKGVIFDIKKYAIHDGPGIRTTVFFKGCPLCCSWCHNPESWDPQPEVMYRPVRCIRCGRCVEICPQHTLELKNNRVERNSAHCRTCGACIEPCPADAREIVGQQITAGHVLREIEKDSIFYDQSGGGVTFSGGEPLMQQDFLTALLFLCKNRDFHTAVDTSCYAKSEVIHQITNLVDLFLCDLKHMDPKKHREFTGVDNVMILDNLHWITDQAREVIIRIPIIPGFNDRPEEIESIGKFVKSLKTVKQIDFLPYNSGGITKAERLEKHQATLKTRRPQDEYLRELSEIVEAMDFKVKIGG